MSEGCGHRLGDPLGNQVGILVEEESSPEFFAKLKDSDEPLCNRLVKNLPHSQRNDGNVLALEEPADLVIES